MKKLMIIFGVAFALFATPSLSIKACDYEEVGEFGRPGYIWDSPEQIAEEKRLGDMELIAQLVEAEAGNQDLEGKRLVVDVVLNRVASDKFPNTVEEVIFQEGQFSVVRNGAWNKAAYNMKDTDYEAVKLEYDSSERLNTDILYFNCNTQVAGTGTPFKVGGHYFNT